MNKKCTAIEEYIIEAVRKKRNALGISTNKLSYEIGMSKAFVSKVENPKLENKYNFNHLNEIAKVLKCKIADLLPDPYLEEDCIEEYKESHPQRKSKY